MLNRDFAATNTDKTKVPAVWKGLVTDTRLRFTLASVKRKRTTRASFDTDDSVKRASLGGLAPFKPSSHLKVWVCALAGGADSASASVQRLRVRLQSPDCLLVRR